MLVHRILGGIFLSSIDPINQEIELRKEYGITHILSVLSDPISSDYLEGYTHKQIDVTDEETSNLLQFFPETNEFIDSVLFPLNEPETSKKHQGAILIHCAQGVSRSGAVIIAYLMYKYKLKYPQALHAVTRKVPGVDPNDGFKHQLKIYEEMEYEVLLKNEIYKQFLIDLSLRLDPSGASLRNLHFFNYMDQYEEDEPEIEEYYELDDETALSEDPEALSEMRCKRCRFLLAKKKHLEFHAPPDASSRQSFFTKTAPNSRRIISKVEASKNCSHYFFREPVKWMRQELQSKGDIEGKFQCPKCESKVGGYSWKGSRCSCGKWMVPAIHLQSARVDFIKKAHQENNV